MRSILLALAVTLVLGQSPPAAPDPGLRSIHGQESQKDKPAENRPSGAEGIRIQALPDLSIQRDQIDYVLVLFNVIIIGTGMFGVIAANRTLRAVQTQAGLMQKQAELMHRQVQVMDEQLKHSREANSQNTSTAVETLQAIKEQASLQGRAIELQARNMQQWVDYGNWSHISECDPSNPNYMCLFISFEIVNPTPFPVTLPAAVIRFEVGKSNIELLFPENFRLLPNKPYPAQARLELSKEQQGIYLSGYNGLPVKVSGDLTHVGVLGGRDEQLFQGFVRCGTCATAFEEQTPAQQGQSEENQGNGANLRMRRTVSLQQTSPPSIA